MIPCNRCGAQMIWQRTEWICYTCGHAEEPPLSPERSKLRPSVVVGSRDRKKRVERGMR
jgi:ribosomal protein L37E